MAGISIKGCGDCPFQHRTGYGSEFCANPHATGWPDRKAGKTLVLHMHKDRPPHWCPLRGQSVTVELVEVLDRIRDGVDFGD